MQLHLISHNVQGLNAPLAPQTLNHYYKEHFRTLDILCLHEYKLRGPKLTELGNQVWRDAYLLHCAASLAYNHDEDERGAGSGGICTFVSPQINGFAYPDCLVGTLQSLMSTLRINLVRE
jgi:hypothetical protein